MEIAQHTIGPSDRLSIDGFRGRPRLLVISPLVKQLAFHLLICVGGCIAEGVVDMRQFRRRPAGYDILDQVIATIDAPFDEVADQFLVAVIAAGAGDRCRHTSEHQEHGQHGREGQREARGPFSSCRCPHWFVLSK